MNILYTLIALACVIAVGLYIGHPSGFLKDTTTAVGKRIKRGRRPLRAPEEITSATIQHVIINVIKTFEETYLSRHLTESRFRRLAIFSLYMEREMMGTIRDFDLGGDSHIPMLRDDLKFRTFCARLYDLMVGRLYHEGKAAVGPKSADLTYQAIKQHGLFAIFFSGMLEWFYEFDTYDDLEFEIITKEIEDKEIDRYITYLNDTSFDRSRETDWMLPGL